MEGKTSAVRRLPSAVRMEKGGYLGDGFSRFALFVVECIYETIGAADRYLWSAAPRVRPSSSLVYIIVFLPSASRVSPARPPRFYPFYLTTRRF